MQIAISAIMSTVISFIILNCGENIGEWMGGKFEDVREWLRKKRK